MAQFMRTFTTAHYGQARRILQYLLTTKDHVLHLGGTAAQILRSAPNPLHAETGLRTTARKTGCRESQALSNSAWAAFKHSQDEHHRPSPSLSITEAEYTALCITTQNVMFLRYLLDELEFLETSKPTIIFVDNESAIKISGGDVTNSRCNHMRPKIHYPKYMQAAGHIIPMQCGSEDQAADLLTKVITSRPQIERLRRFFGIMPREP